MLRSARLGFDHMGVVSNGNLPATFVDIECGAKANFSGDTIHTAVGNFGIHKMVDFISARTKTCSK